MFQSNKSYTNRYGDTYSFEKVSPSTYKFVMTGNSLYYGRVGGREGVEGLDFSDLGMFDPSGGPYISLGTKVDDKPIIKIASIEHQDGYVVEVGL